MHTLLEGLCDCVLEIRNIQDDITAVSLECNSLRRVRAGTSACSGVQHKALKSVQYIVQHVILIP